MGLIYITHVLLYLYKVKIKLPQFKLLVKFYPIILNPKGREAYVAFKDDSIEQ